MDDFAEVWQDSAKLTLAILHLLRLGTNAVRQDDYDTAAAISTVARYFEQCIAVELKRSQDLLNWPKIEEAYNADMHTLVKFFRRRIPCSCLDEKYQEVKHVTKMGFCFNTECKYPGNKVEHSKTKYCSRCRSVTYCSRECQVADWSRHKPICDNSTA